jgi:hypothetical protein
MNSKAFRALVQKMRNAERSYFAGHSKDVLKLSTMLEKQVDQEIQRVKAIQDNGLFPDASLNDNKEYAFFVAVMAMRQSYRDFFAWRKHLRGGLPIRSDAGESRQLYQRCLDDEKVVDNLLAKG